MKAAIIIPARYASSRLPGKPLLAETGKPLIQYTYEKAAASSAAQVVVATDDERIRDIVAGFGGEAVMTSPDHESGTARVAEVARGLDAEIIINMQGDEPETEPAHLDALIDLHAATLADDRPAFASTLVCPFAAEPVTGPGSPSDPACVKAVLSGDAAALRRVLYFSRALVPFPRDAAGIVADPTSYFLHIGIYAFSRDSVQAFASLPHSALEETEKLEQLRILEAGEWMAAAIVPAAAPGIDTPEDYEAFIRRTEKGAA